MGRLLGCAAALLAASAAGANAKVADTYTVAPGTADSTTTTPCTATGTATFSCANLRSAVATAQTDNGSTVRLSAGPYTLAAGQLIVATTKDFAIAGAGSGQTTIQQTTANERVMKLGADQLSISGVTISGGNQTTIDGQCTYDFSGLGQVVGGGIFNTGALTLADVTVTGNTVTGPKGADASSGTAGTGVDAQGGGICSSGPLTVIDSTITGNRATGGHGGKATGSAKAGWGGGAAGGGIETSGDLSLSGSTVQNNQAIGGAAGDGSGTGGNGGSAFGGGIGLYESASLTDPTASIDDSRIEGNAEVGGAGPHVASTVQIGSGGSAEGAIANESLGAITITHTTIASNTTAGGAAGTQGGGTSGGDAGNAGGAGVFTSGPLTMTASTVSGNTAIGGPASAAPGGTGGVAFGGGLYVQDPTTMVNTTIAGNAVSSGAGATARGGGVYDQQIGAGTTTLASVTIANNSATAITAAMADGGNLDHGSASPISMRDTIIAGGASNGTGSDCGSKISLDGGHNLESTTPTQCGLDPSAADLIGVDPALGPLANNGGTTQTMALGAGSPAIGAGGQCTDPNNAGQPLQSDQRGQPRANPCDIGAFEGQPPIAGAPTIGPGPTVGRTTTCSTGATTGDAPLTAAFQWLRDGHPITAAAGATYAVALTDAGHKLTCQVTETNAYGHAIATSVPTTVPFPAPAVGRIHQSHKRWREGSKLAKVSRKATTPLGTTFTFALNLPASLTLSFSARHARTRTLKLAARHAGTVRIRFDGRLSKHKTLPTGRYKLTITAKAHGRKSKPRTASFTIVG
jgi:hypothetical protein